MNNIQLIPADYVPSKDCLQDKVILVTGAGDGIGREAALCFATHGACVILLGKTESKLADVYDEIVDKGHPTPALCPFDLKQTDYKAYSALKKAITEEFGKLDGILHNAGALGELSSIASYNPNTWFDTMQVNVNAQFLLTKAFLPLLQKSSSASIVFTSSSVGRKGRAYWGAYAVSKFATEGLMQTLADELEKTGNIRCNCINPGATRTHMRAKAYPAENPDEVAPASVLMPAYLYLMGDKSKSINGQSFDAQKK